MAIVVSSTSPATVYRREWNKKLTITGTGFAALGFAVTFSDTEIEVLQSIYISATEGVAYVNIPDTCTAAAGTVTVTTTAGGAGTSAANFTVADNIDPMGMPKPEEASGAYLPFINSEGKACQMQLDASGQLPVVADLVVHDIEIGAVELKDGTADTRVTVKSDGVNNAVVVTANGVTNLATNQVAIGNTSTLIRAATVGRKTILITNPDTNNLYVGVTGVTTANGFVVPPKCTVGLGGFTGAIYGVYAAVGPTTVSYLEV
jgi:hypothetical protein